MKKAIIYIILLLALSGYLSCKKPFSTTLPTVATNFLAVDGAIISGDTTLITLSRTTSLSDTTQNKGELKALVVIEDNQGKQYTFTEKGKGVYFLPTVNFDPAHTYRLDIKTRDGKIYQSDFVPMKVTPPMDSLYYTVSEKNVQFYTDTHDPANNTRYYRWDYEEVWQYTSFVEQFFAYKNGAIVLLNDGINFPANAAYYCYMHAFSANQVLIGTSANLSQDVIKKQQLQSLADTSKKLSEIYVLILRQYALTKDGYNYYQNLKTNTEQLGSIFDAQPSYIKGNIHCITSPTDLVLGFVSVSTVTTKMVIFHYYDFGVFKVADPHLKYGPDSAHCVGGLLRFDPAATFATRAKRTLASGDTLIGNLVYGRDPLYGLIPLGYGYAPKQCVDCSYAGGTKTRPSYFPPPF